MTEKVKAIFKDLAELSEVEKKEFFDEFKKHFSSGNHERRSMSEGMGDKVSRILGPTSMNNCPMCGK